MFSKKRTVNNERRVVQDKWKILYFYVEINGKPTCFICNQQVAVADEYKVRRHYETNHAMKYNKYSGELLEDKVKELEQSLKKQRSVFKSVHQVSDAAVKASYRIAHEIAVSSKPFSKGNFINKCMLMASEDICPEKRQAFANISLSRNTVAERIGELSENINSQLTDKVKSFTAFSVAFDESTDVSDVAQLAVFIRGVDENMQVTEEFVKLVPMKGTATGDDIFVRLVGALDKLGVDWAQTVSLATDGAQQMLQKVPCSNFRYSARFQQNGHTACSAHTQCMDDDTFNLSLCTVCPIPDPRGCPAGKLGRAADVHHGLCPPPVASPDQAP
ncbi:general transcription factor II-I repeat domain-containing protein 2-like [Homarus americanus]|uniref:general transcription factor II-I repeat domain-containing protein 2-like n=1 Tax=Homarus americanus TaxID=6706 RepID=UPI001C45CA75|nr:general transcription factor II-I repeat domain-containing protein 2-like [Homarus americanus]